jgi:hypothetical protein
MNALRKLISAAEPVAAPQAINPILDHERGTVERRPPAHGGPGQRPFC